MDEVGRELDLRARARREFEAGRLSREEFIATVAEIDDEIARLQAAQPVVPAPPTPEHGEDGLTREYIAGRISADTYVSAGGDPDVVRDTESRRADEAAARKAAVDKSSNRMMLGCLAIPILLIGGCVALTSMGGGSSREDTASDLSYSARSTCEKAIEQQLKDPSSAEYSDVDIAITDGSAPDFAYEVTGTVRAENSFGGMAVHSFVCTATYTGSDEMMRARATLS